MRTMRILLLVLTLTVGSTGVSWGYIDRASTILRVYRESQSISLVEIDRSNREKGAIILKLVRDIKGQCDQDALKHQIIRPGETSPDRAILDWADAGNRCLLFLNGKNVLVCVGEGWYQATKDDDGWCRIGTDRPDLPLAYYGTVSRLENALTQLVANKKAVITTLTHGGEESGGSYELALNRANLPGLVRIQRIYASHKMPDSALGVGNNPAVFVGLGRAGKEEIPTLREKLQSNDASVRTESAIDLGSLGADAKEATDELKKLLTDQAPVVRAASAAALLRIKVDDKEALGVLAKELASGDATIRRHATRAAGLAGAGAAPLAGKLGELLQDSDPLVARSALQAIATIGPNAAEAMTAVTALLSKSETAIDAADALGRMGAKARSALPELTRLLQSEIDAKRWAAVRAMAQIGGKDAAPAVDFMVKNFPRGTDIEIYHSLIYMTLLGSVAKEAIPAIRTSRIVNPALREIAIWAIDPEAELPWRTGIGDVNFARMILETFVNEMGDQLKPAAAIVVKKIMAGTAGEVPPWGYKLLAHFPEQTLAALTPALKDKDLAQRERAAVVLGYMGPVAVPARPNLETALAAAQLSGNEKEQRLLQWCLREIAKQP